MSLNVSNRNNRPRYGFVRNPNCEHGRQVEHALYDIVDNVEGAEQVLAYGVKYQPAVEIVGALNAREEFKRFSKDWK